MGGAGSGRKPHGRPPKLTDELTQEIAKLVEMGNYFETAAACVGVAPKTLRQWLNKGANQQRGLYRRFSTALKKAEAKAEASSVVRIRAHGEKAWQALAWYLERKHPDRWRKAPENDDNDGGERRLTLKVVNMGQDEDR